jgi:GNAT superfamily N-acetyltransferase
MVGLPATQDVDYELGGDVWQRTKQIDGHPNREWTFPVFTSRLIALDRTKAPLGMYYEPLETSEQVLRLERVNADQLHAGASWNVRQQVGIGLKWRRSGFSAERGRLPKPTPTDEFVGRHWVWLLALTPDESALVFLNRWSDWGDDRRGYLPLEYFDDYVDDIWLNRSSRHGASPAQARDAGSRQSLPDARQAWAKRREHVVSRELICGRIRDLHSGLVTSQRTQENVRILEVRAAGNGIGRIHLRFGREKLTAWIDELFVRPSHRRSGIGTFLLTRAMRVARSEKYATLAGPLFEADAVARGAAGAEVFFRHADFEWTQEVGRRPSYRSIARRAL